MRPAAPQTVRAVEAASALYNASPAPNAAALRDARGSASSDDDTDSLCADDGWIPVPLEVVSTWRTLAITAEALERGHSLDLAGASASAAGGLQEKMAKMRVVASCNNLPSLLAPPAPAPRPPPLVVAIAPSSSGSSARMSCDQSVSDLGGGSLDLPREPRDSVTAHASEVPAHAAEAPSPLPLAGVKEQRGRNGSPLPWLAPLAKKLRRNTSFGRLCGGAAGATQSPPP